MASAAVATSSAGASELHQLEAASALRARRLAAWTDLLEWEHAGAELASAYRATLQLARVHYLGSPSIMMDELADP